MTVRKHEGMAMGGSAEMSLGVRPGSWFGALPTAALLIAGAFTSTTSHAWGTEGHHVVALIAQSQLTPKARAEVTRLLELEPGQTLRSISTWADEHRNPTTAAWHYVNLPRNS